MDGTELLDEISRRIMKRTGTKSVRDSTLAQELGVTQSALRNYRSKELTSRNVVNLMDKFAKKAQRRLMDETLIPIVEFFNLDPVETKQGGNWHVFSTKDDNGTSHPCARGDQGNRSAQHDQNGAENKKAPTCAPVVGHAAHHRRDDDRRQAVHGLAQPNHRTLTVRPDGFSLDREHHRLDNPLQPAA
jgi:hypothetical protein